MGRSAALVGVKKGGEGEKQLLFYVTSDTEFTSPPSCQCERAPVRRRRLHRRAPPSLACEDVKTIKSLQQESVSGLHCSLRALAGQERRRGNQAAADASRTRIPSPSGRSQRVWQDFGIMLFVGCLFNHSFLLKLCRKPATNIQPITRFERKNRSVDWIIQHFSVPFGSHLILEQ